MKPRFAWIAVAAALAVPPSFAFAQTVPTASSTANYGPTAVGSIVRVSGLSHLFSRAHQSRQSSDGGSSRSGSCPCSGRHICTGPRGGRYCITSGGNKRYGV